MPLIAHFVIGIAAPWNAHIRAAQGHIGTGAITGA